MARDFDPNFVLKTAGILYVFQGFYKQKLGQNLLPLTLVGLIIGYLKGRMHWDERKDTIELEIEQGNAKLQKGVYVFEKKQTS